MDDPRTCFGQDTLHSQTLSADCGIRRKPASADFEGPGSDALYFDTMSPLPSLCETVAASEFVNFESKYTCIQCDGVLVDAMQTPCGHRICSPCVKNMLPNGNSVHCPAMEEECVELTTGNICRDSGARREVRNLLVYCKNKNYGCTATVPLGQFGSHLDTCEFRPIQCEHLGCSVALPRDSLQQHQRECPYVLEVCQSCFQQIPKKNIEEHTEKDCLEANVKCPNDCGTSHSRRDLPSHIESCPLSVSSCKFSSMGCMYKGLSEELLTHHSGSLATHLDLALIYIAQLEMQSVKNERQIKDMKTEIKKIKHEQDGLKKQNEDLVCKIGDLKNTIKDSKIKMVNLTERCIILERSIRNKAEKSDVERLGRDLAVVQGIQTQILNNENGQSSTTGPSTATQLTAIDKSVGLHDVRLAEMDLRFQILETVSYTGELMWKVTDYHKRKREATNGRTMSLYSQPFYTSRYGYKMCARLYLNGDGIGRGTHMSLYFVVMRSNFDDLLEWPFTKKITMMLFDQDSRANHLVETFYTDKNSSSFKKPSNEMNIASGCPLFISQSRVECPQEPYLKHDTIYIKVAVKDV